MPSRKPWRPTTKSPSIPAPARLLPPVPSNLKRLPKEPFLLPAVTHSAALICRYAIGCADFERKSAIVGSGLPNLDLIPTSVTRPAIDLYGLPSVRLITTLGSCNPWLLSKTGRNWASVCRC